MEPHMRVAGLLRAGILIASLVASPLAALGQGSTHVASPVYVLAHFDVLPMAVGGVDFLKAGYGLLFRYRDQSNADAGLESFRILDLVAPTTNHSEIVQAWDSYEAY